MGNEIWKDVPGYEGYYQASNLGRIKSLDHYAKGGHGAEKQLVKGRMLKPRKHGGKYITYLTVSLCTSGVPKENYVHRVIWSAFNGPIPEGLVINHKDENPENNNLENLMVCTQQENLAWGTHNERISKTLKERAKIINPIINIRKNHETN